jgi:hypothetical protein
MSRCYGFSWQMALFHGFAQHPLHTTTHAGVISAPLKLRKGGGGFADPAITVFIKELSCIYPFLTARGER